MDRLQEEGELSAQGCRWGVQPPGRRSSWGGRGERSPRKSKRNHSGEDTEENGNHGVKGTGPVGRNKESGYPNRRPRGNLLPTRDLQGEAEQVFFSIS